jgi:hypothetical protein
MQFRSKFYRPEENFFNAGGGVETIDNFIQFFSEIPLGMEPNILIVGLDQYFFNHNWSKTMAGNGKDIFKNLISSKLCVTTGGRYISILFGTSSPWLAFLTGKQIRSDEIAKSYVENWKNHKDHSEPYGSRDGIRCDCNTGQTCFRM